MARLPDRLPSNVPGDLFVDSSCIDCATCRQMAPRVFAAGDGFSFVRRQPDGAGERLSALKALVACPTGSIGTESRSDAREAVASFPERIDGDVFFCGFTSKESYGAWSYLVVRPEGNALVDSPRAAAPLVSRIRAMGGASLLLLTHRDDVADHERLRAGLGCERVLHLRDAVGRLGAVERKPDGDEPVLLADDLLMIPTPGHTRGHAVFLAGGRYLFTGDHLAYSERLGHLYAFRDACWFSWEEQVRSMERLLAYEFEWVLPGHGARFRAGSAAEMRGQVEACIGWMKRQRRG